MLSEAVSEQLLLRLRMSSSEVLQVLPYLEFGKMCIMGKRGVLAHFTAIEPLETWPKSL